jgi:hypothetical protein
MIDSVQVKDVDLLAEAVHHVEVVADPVHGHSYGAPGARNAAYRHTLQVS